MEKSFGRSIPIFLLAIALFSCTAFAASVNLTSSLDGNGVAHVIIETFHDTPNVPFSLNISPAIDSVTVRDRLGAEVNATVQQNDAYTLVSATVPYDYLSFEFGTDALTDKIGDIWQYGISISSNEPFDGYSASLKLPAGAVVERTSSWVEADGDSVGLVWKSEPGAKPATITLNAAYSIKAADATEASAQNQDRTTQYIIIAMCLVAISVSIVYWRRSKKASQAKQAEREAKPQHPYKPRKTVNATATLPQAQLDLEHNKLFSTLDENDKEILREIIRQGGKTTQARIYLQTHIAKATLSRRLASLAQRGIIRKSQQGNRNLISLTDLLSQ